MTPSPSLSRTYSPTSPFRASAHNSPGGPPTPQTPSSVPRLATALRRSTLPAAASPSPRQQGMGMNHPVEGDSSLLTAYFARHSPSRPSLLLCCSVSNCLLTPSFSDSTRSVANQQPCGDRSVARRIALEARSSHITPMPRRPATSFYLCCTEGFFIILITVRVAHNQRCLV